ncbi:hypothetical protein KKE14_01085 [Patescibacteria group bacterium]|nr:hypothetical protein [Patescibacteria group bacterium]
MPNWTDENLACLRRKLIEAALLDELAELSPTGLKKVLSPETEQEIEVFIASKKIDDKTMRSFLRFSVVLAVVTMIIVFGWRYLYNPSPPEFAGAILISFFGMCAVILIKGYCMTKKRDKEIAKLTS